MDPPRYLAYGLGTAVPAVHAVPLYSSTAVIPVLGGLGGDPDAVIQAV